MEQLRRQSAPKKSLSRILGIKNTLLDLELEKDKEKITL